ncbi:MAG: porin [Bacteroidia bacterium]
MNKKQSLFRNLTLLLFMIFASHTLMAQTDSLKVAHSEFKPAVETKAATKWYDKFAIRGYSQIRYNRLLETNPNINCEQCDKSIGKNGGIFMRRMRVIIYGQVNKQVYFYVQPDFASSAASDKLHFGQIRDAYFDVGLDESNEFRFRFGQSKVPFGFENMQSSQNRLPLDRHDALNSAVANERDMGVFFYWAPKKTRKLFSELVSSGLKGSGDYGVFAYGVYNGQTANTPELNDELHQVARITYPFQVGSQIIEAGVQGYTGKYVLPKANLSTGVKTANKDLNYDDQRVAASFILYPKPFGIQLEYNVGKGPEYNKNTGTIETKNLKGGYLLLNYQLHAGKHLFIPFTRMHTYQGGKKHERDARSYRVNEVEIGMEWQPIKQFELVAMYTISERRFEDHTLQNNLQSGEFLRLQAQVNF